MQYIKIIVIALIVSIIMEFLGKFIIEKYGIEKAFHFVKVIAVVAIAMYISQII